MKAFSGKLVLRMDPTLHRKVAGVASSKNISLNQHLLNLITDAPAEPRIIAALRQHFGETLIGIVLFGSTVRGERRTSSDIDLLIVLRDERPIERELYREWDSFIAPLADARHSPQFSHLPKLGQGPSSLWLEVALEGEVLWDGPKHPVRQSLRMIREEVARGKYTRKLSHGHPYWIREQKTDAE